MDNVYKEAFAEVLKILENSNEDIVKKIPEKFIDFLNQNMDEDYIVNIDFKKSNWENDVKPETQAIVALLYRDYIVSPEKREELLKEEAKEQIKVEQELKEKYNVDNLFKKKEEIISEELGNNEQLIKNENYPWYRKLYYKVLEILKIRR